MEHQTLIRYPPTNNSLLSSGNTKKSITYEPRTEAISPAINDDIINTEEADSQSTKDEQTLLVEKLRKVEAEIIQTDKQITRLRRQKEQLEQVANSASKDDDDQENVCDTKQLSIAKLVYHENRAKAQKASARLECLGGASKDLPLYNQPSDNAIYHHNAAKFTTSFKSTLITCFRLRLQNRLKLEGTVSTEYDRRMEKWLKSIEVEDFQPSKRVKDAKTREYFEKQFPELKKARESGERFSRVGQRVARSDAELDELLDGITEREDQDKKVKSYAVIPPMLEEMRSRKPKYINTNGYVEDIVAQYKEYQILNTWTDEEKEIFRENYLQHPKDFGLIARMTTRKNVANCIQYYYLSKKSDNYKQLLKRQQKRRTRSFVRPAPATPANPAVFEANNETNNGKTSNGTDDKQAGDSNATDATNQHSSGQTDSSKQSASTDRADIKTSDSDNNKNIDSNNQAINSTCCICNCISNDNQFRNVTRSNYQLYGIGLDSLKPGMKICYPCRFRHVKHPSFDEFSLSPEPMDHEDEIIQGHEMMEVDTTVIKTDPEPVIESDGPEHNKFNIPPKPASPHKELLITEQASGPSNGESNKGPQRTCVRDIIYQAIEMSFQKPKATESMDIHPAPDPIRAERAPPVNTNLAPHSISSIMPLKHMGTNHAPMPNSLPPHLPLQNLTIDQQHQLQVEMQQKQRQQLLEYNLRQHQIQVQMQQQRQFRQQQYPIPPQNNISQQLPPSLQHPQQQPPQQMLVRHPTQSLPPGPPQPNPLRHGPSPSAMQPPMSHPMLSNIQSSTAAPPSILQTPRPTLSAIVPPTHHQPVSAPATMPVAHPLNLCRKYSEPLFQPDPQKAQPLKPKPPMAHGAKGPKVAAPIRSVIEDCVLNLSAKHSNNSSISSATNYSMVQANTNHNPTPPPTAMTATATPPPLQLQQLPPQPPPPLQQLPPQPPPPLQHLPQPPPPPLQQLPQQQPPSQQQLPPPPPPPKTAPIVVPKLEAEQPQNSKQQPPSPELSREESRSPNLTGSPTSPSEMVIDESAGAVSPGSASDNQENGP